MKVVTIGVTKFASKLLGMVDDIPVTAWVYPENRLEGFLDFSVSVDVMQFYIKNIGPYPFSKLANMQAKTQWGGLENAGTIAYSENSITGNNNIEGLIAHEIAHQWFGNSASENDWNHVWLSEGFATYFTILYQEDVYGNDKRKEELELDRKQIIEYYNQNPSTIVDSNIKDPRRVLSVNTYQKGSWVLNMLRHLVGDGVFWKGIRKYYDSYKNTNALTEDFRTIMEEISGLNLEEFFDQWVYTKGYPELAWSWAYEDGFLKLKINQEQNHHVFNFPLEVGVISGNQMYIETVQIDSKSNSFKILLEAKPDHLLIDPEVWLLYEEK
jgi:aminopeptidase N